MDKISIIFVSALLFGTGCRAGIAPKSRSAPESGQLAAPSAEDPSATSRLPAANPEQSVVMVAPERTSAATRLFFQSGSSFSLWLEPDFVDGGETLSVTNETTGNVLVGRQQLALNDGYSLAAIRKEGGYVVVHLGLYAPDGSRPLAFGANTLLIATEGVFGVRELRRTLYLRDFPVSGVLVASSGDGGYENGPTRGWISVEDRPMAVAGKTGRTFTSGVMPIISK